jgi:hypothetical protein
LNVDQTKRFKEPEAENALLNRVVAMCADGGVPVALSVFQTKARTARPRLHREDEATPDFRPSRYLRSE